MGVVLLFMLLGTATPFLFLELNKTVWAVVHTALIVGMWMYFFETMIFSAPAAFSILWISFYASLIIAHIGWLMFLIHTVNLHQRYQRSYQ